MPFLAKALAVALLTSPLPALEPVMFRANASLYQRHLPPGLAWDSPAARPEMGGQWYTPLSRQNTVVDLAAFEPTLRRALQLSGLVK